MDHNPRLIKLDLKLYLLYFCFFYLLSLFTNCESLAAFTFILSVESVQKNITEEKHGPITR